MITTGENSVSIGPAAIVGSVVAVIAAVLFVPFARLGVDTHHDGVMFAAAMAVRHGFHVQSGAYSQYGPISAWLQAFELLVFGDSVVVIKICSAVALALSVGLVAFCVALRAGIPAALLTAGVWITCFPAIDDTFMMLAWSSDYLLLTTTLAFALICASELTRFQTKLRIYFVVGVLFGLIPFVRVNSGLPALCAAVAGATFFLPDRRLKIRLLCGVAAGFLGVVAYFLLTGGLYDLYEQAFVFPRSLYAGQMANTGYSGLKGNSVVNGLPAIASVSLICAWAMMAEFPRYSRTIKFASQYLVILISALALWWLLSDGARFGLVEPRQMLWGVVPAAIVILPYLFRTTLGSDAQSHLFPNFILLSVSFAGLVQIFPVTDRRHLWWAVLPMLGILISEALRRMSVVRQVLVGIFIVGLLAQQSLHASLVTFRQNRIRMEDVSTLRGSLVSDDFRRAFEFQFIAISQFREMHGDRAVLNLCMDGYFSTIGGKFDLPDPYYIYWSLPKQVWSWEEREEWVAKHKPFIWMCSPVTDPQVTAEQFGYRLVSTDSCISSDDKFRNWPLVGYLAVPREWSSAEIETRIVRGDRCKN